MDKNILTEAERVIKRRQFGPGLFWLLTAQTVGCPVEQGFLTLFPRSTAKKLLEGLLEAHRQRTGHAGNGGNVVHRARP